MRIQTYTRPARISQKRLQQEFGGRMPFSTIKAKRKTDKTFKDGRVRLADKSDLRLKAFERSGGHCEEIVRCPLPECNERGIAWHTFRCFKPITLESMHLSHRKHGPRRDDTLKSVIASCEECHVKRHNAGGKPCPPKPKDL